SAPRAVICTEQLANALGGSACSGELMADRSVLERHLVSRLARAREQGRDVADPISLRSFDRSATAKLATARGMEASRLDQRPRGSEPAWLSRSTRRPSRVNHGARVSILRRHSRII